MCDKTYGKSVYKQKKNRKNEKKNRRKKLIKNIKMLHFNTNFIIFNFNCLYICNGNRTINMLYINSKSLINKVLCSKMC